MTLEELNKKIAKADKVKVNVTVEPHDVWINRREREDKHLSNMDCPECMAGVSLLVKNGCTTYTCNKNPEHKYERWVSLITDSNRWGGYGGHLD